MVRARRPLTWWRLPGTLAAYQPIAAPSEFQARLSTARVYNVAPYAATPGWSAQDGWTFSYAEDWTTNIAAANGYTILVRAVPGSTGRPTAGSSTFWVRIQSGTYVEAVGSNYVGASAAAQPRVAGVGGTKLYADGVSISSSLNGTGISGTIYIGSDGGGSRFIGSIQAALIAQRTLSPAEVALASHQMAYCEFNPAWNAWAPERRYFVMAPAAAASAAKMNTYFRRMRS